jgi:hypothetical protein
VAFGGEQVKMVGSCSDHPSAIEMAVVAGCDGTDGRPSFGDSTQLAARARPEGMVDVHVAVRMAGGEQLALARLAATTLSAVRTWSSERLREECVFQLGLQRARALTQEQLDSSPMCGLLRAASASEASARAALEKARAALDT